MNNKYLTAPTEIIEELFQHYKNLFAQPDGNPDDRHDTQIDKDYDEILSRLITRKENVKPTNLLEIKRIIKQLKSKKWAVI